MNLLAINHDFASDAPTTDFEPTQITRGLYLALMEAQSPPPGNKKSKTLIPILTGITKQSIINLSNVSRQKLLTDGGQQAARLCPFFIGIFWKFRSL